MEYRIEELATRSGVRIDTIRFYQGRGLLAAPRRRGRIAIYDAAHLARLRRIRQLLGEGLSLNLIRRVLSAEEKPAARRASLVSALVAERVGARTLSRAELAAESGVPEALILAAQGAGLFQPVRLGDEERFGEADLDMARAALTLLGAGIPLHELTDLAVRHARATQEICEGAIDLFDRHVRRPNGEPADAESVTARFRELLPAVTRLVALFFQRTLVSRALARGDADDHAQRAALAGAESSRLEVTWK
jgi:DNA-binding transcriptional MerR regulator